MWKHSWSQGMLLLGNHQKANGAQDWLVTTCHHLKNPCWSGWHSANFAKRSRMTRVDCCVFWSHRMFGKKEVCRVFSAFGLCWNKLLLSLSIWFKIIMVTKMRKKKKQVSQDFLFCIMALKSLTAWDFHAVWPICWRPQLNPEWNVSCAHHVVNLPQVWTPNAKQIEHHDHRPEQKLFKPLNSYKKAVASPLDTFCSLLGKNEIKLAKQTNFFNLDWSQTQSDMSMRSVLWCSEKILHPFLACLKRTHSIFWKWMCQKQKSS